jgi:NAD(P)H-hydrate epimerase
VSRTTIRIFVAKPENHPFVSTPSPQKVLSARQTRELDAATIDRQNITSLELMNRAVGAFCERFMRHFPPPCDAPVWIFCGSGNNGGDGLGIARKLHEAHYEIRVFDCQIGNRSPDNAAQYQTLRDKRVIPITALTTETELPAIPPGTILIDGVFGSGLSRPVEGYWADLLDRLNTASAERVAIDMPSGLFADQPTTSIAFHADLTLSFQLPKLAFLLPGNAAAVGRWETIDIGLDQDTIAATATNNFYQTAADLHPMLRLRQPFDHKGTFGHALIVAGSYGKIGAAILCSRAVLRAGAGLVTVHTPRCGYEILQIAFPEAMVVTDRHRFVLSEVGSLDAYAAIGIGPGIGTNACTVEALRELLRRTPVPPVLDADALNILARHPELLAELPAGSLLTPHPKEFERLFGATPDDFARLELLRDKARELQAVIVLKTGTTAIATPDGRLYFNSSGNPGMGTAGTGDVLTGILTGLRAQGYDPVTAARLGVYLHGLAGDLAAEELEQESLIAEDVIDHLGKAFRRLKKEGT